LLSTFLSALQPHVVPIFATPFGVVSLPDASSLNPELVTLFAGRTTPDRAQPGVQRAFSFRSREDLFDWTEEPVRKLKGDITAAVIAVARSINDFSDEQFAGLRVQARAWFTVLQPNGSVPSVYYPNTSWCAVYCVSAPQTSPVRPDSGVLRLHESSRATMFSDATNSVTQLPYTPGHSTWRPVPGQVAVFPASITHEIALLRVETGHLVLVTALLRFFGASQTGMPWW
jgi:hypothetical protein